MNDVIIIGGGYSVKEGIDKQLWDKIQHKGIDVWSVNFSHMFMPFNPSVQIWADIGVWTKGRTELIELHSKGTELICKNYAGYDNNYFINKYDVTPFIEKSSETNIFIGRMGLSGVFALSLAISRKYENIYLLGYDFGSTHIRNNNTHWYEDLNEDINAGSYGRSGIYWAGENKIRDEIKDFDIIKKHTKVEVYNVSLTSNIISFPKLSYDEFYKRIEDNK